MKASSEKARSALANEKIERTAEQREVAETVAVATVEATWPQTRAVLRIIFIVLAVAGVLWILYALEGVLLLVVLSIFFAYLISPLVELARRPFKVQGRERAMPRVFAIGIVYLLLFGSLGLILYFLLPSIGRQVSEFSKSAPDYLTNARSRAGSLNRLYDRFQLPSGARAAANNAVNGAFKEAEDYSKGQGKYENQGGLSEDALTVIGYLPWLILVPILAFFLLKDADSFRRSALQMLPQGRLRWRGDEFFQDINSTLAAYIRAQLTACLLIGAICTIGFMIIGMRYSLVLGIIAGLFEFIPLAGPLAVAVLAGAVASFYSGSQVIVVLVFLIVLRIVHDYVIYPRIIGQGIHLHPLAVVLAILCGEELAGLAGIFLAIPVIAIMTVTYRHWLEHRGSSGLVADLLKPAEPAAIVSPAIEPQTPAPVIQSPAPTTSQLSALTKATDT